ncbi:uncharacterized protein BKA55DRAFT_695907 [Fusarium redolens]|uniref:DEP domain-containing protein n=1 Tax=Fusarium redolens TaxID=48865 RepID=A0A9P9JNW5_FUSRE|nr:uncharacterized protein BKA55DRAFT_695907 [Fusarium redolens]KAH7231673.1 hypothetical protein BKA55DRAFT_695907 [Fusarium redolens]
METTQLRLRKAHQTDIAVAAENLNPVGTLDRALFAINTLDLEPEKLRPINATYTPANTFCLPLYAATSVVDPKEPAHGVEDLNRLLIHPKPARTPEAMSSGRRKHETYQKRLVAVHQHGVSCITLLKWPLCRILLSRRFTRLPPSNTLEQPSTHFRSSLLEQSHPGVVTAAAIAVASPARPAQAHVYVNRHTGSVSKLNQRSSSGILALVVAGPDRTQSAIATILDLAIPPQDTPTDFKDLLSTLVVSLLPLSAHHVRLAHAEYTFISEDAINNLGSLKFSQSNRMPDPEDPSCIVTTATTTTFSMAKDMARPICQRFVDARFVESADGKYQQGITVLDRFCSRNGIQQKQKSKLVNLGATKLVLLDRDSQSDMLPHDQGTLEVIFRRFVGADGRNTKATVNAADSDSLHDYKNDLIGVTMAAERKVNGNMYRDTFTGKATADWLMDCCMIVDKRETVEIATLFV